MAERRVFKTGKDGDGNITKLCNRGQSWSPRSKRDAIADIESNQYRYYVHWEGKKVEVKVVDGPGGKYLRTNWDGTTRNNLEDLPDC